MNWQEHITADPKICNGKPCIKGTRVMVSVILDNLAAGEPYESIVDGYHVTIEDVLACLTYAADLVANRKTSESK